jgi:hypothetical protein
VRRYVDRCRMQERKSLEMCVCIVYSTAPVCINLLYTRQERDLPSRSISRTFVNMKEEAFALQTQKRVPLGFRSLLEKHTLSIPKICPFDYFKPILIICLI